MRIALTYLQKCKAVAHLAQFLLIFVAGCMALAIFTKPGTTDGRPRWYFVVCLLSAPVLVYQLMVPMWTRAERFVNVYVFFGLDALFTIFWFSAAICVVTWSAAGRDQAAKDQKFPPEWPHNCSHFAYGPESKCELSNVTTGFGFLIFILFGLTTAMAAYLVIQFRRTGEFPRPSPAYKSTADPEELDQVKDNTWSSSTRDHDNPFAHEDDDSIHGSRSGYSRAHGHDDEYITLNSTETEHDQHPGRPAHWDAQPEAGINRQNTDFYRAHAPSALDTSEYEDTSYHSSDRRQGETGGGYSYSKH